MKKFVLGFLHKGFLFCSGGPLVLAIIYAALYKCGAVETISAKQVATEIITSTLLAFVAGGINVIYKIEELPMMTAILIHGIVLYIDYVVIYLYNGWLKKELVPFLVFTSCFVMGYVVVWIIVYLINKKKADGLTQKLTFRRMENEKNTSDTPK